MAAISARTVLRDHERSVAQHVGAKQTVYLNKRRRRWWSWWWIGEEE